MVKFTVPSMGTKTAATWYVVQAALGCEVESDHPHDLYEGTRHCVVKGSESAEVTLGNLERLGMVEEVESLPDL